ncbi:MAG: hypothetical protein JSW73_00040 [Candidatus Woesearchaeota archaeon]|nr:MAG: hypothetical protein JSW73_00040 [Candidatus Woesearchaeota archaeon]
MGDNNNLTNVIYDSTRKQFGIIVPPDELVKAVKEKTHRDLTSKISEQFVKQFAIIRYPKPVDSSRMQDIYRNLSVYRIDDLPYDILPKDYVQRLRLTEEKLKEVLNDEKDTIKLLKEGYEIYNKNSDKLLEEAIESNSVAQ